ncbi:PEP-CTERM sorting domain-containing protein [Rugamonas sp. DEMB1]|nr:PEP-CTERM sorting domain-containing protein [Rugamonas sp. DEMB1]WGG52944.1 PEP-CTERM sorting domain-containing protein [Rugamonas sp. DEMB1]
MRINHTASKHPFSAARLSCLAIGAALSCLSPAALAQVSSMVANGNYSYDGNANTALVDSFPTNNSGSVDVLNFSNGANRSETVLHSYGDVNGNFGSRASGAGIYAVNGGFKIVQSFTNTSAVAQLGSFHFQITPGALQNSIGSALTGNQYVESGLSFNLQRGGSSLWNSAAWLRSDAAGTNFIAGGDTSLYSGAGGLYNVNGLSRDVNLGVINAGETIQLTYTLNTYANGDTVAGPDRWVPPGDFVVPEGWSSWDGCTRGMAAASMSTGGCGLEPGDVIHTDGHWVAGDVSGSHASSGDPFRIQLADYGIGFNVDSGGNTLGEVSLSPVPEPTTYAMLLGGMGLMGVLAARRRRRDGR